MLLAALPASFGQSLGLDDHPHRLPSRLLIAHALGAVDGVLYTNSVEAFQLNYRLGARYFEVDLSFTADGELVCFHRGVERQAGLVGSVTNMTTEELLSHRYAGRFTMMTLRTFLEIASEHEDIYIVTDTKDDFADSLEAIATTAAQVDQSLMARIIPQLYFPEQWQDVARIEDEHGPFASVIFTLYQASYEDDEVIAAAHDYSIPIVTMHTSRFTSQLQTRLADIGVATLVHTVNAPEVARSYFNNGVQGLYTDRLIIYRPIRRPSGRRAPIGFIRP